MESGVGIYILFVDEYPNKKLKRKMKKTKTSKWWDDDDEVGTGFEWLNE